MISALHGYLVLTHQQQQKSTNKKTRKRTIKTKIHVLVNETKRTNKKKNKTKKNKQKQQKGTNTPKTNPKTFLPSGLLNKMTQIVSPDFVLSTHASQYPRKSSKYGRIWAQSQSGRFFNVTHRSCKFNKVSIF